ncbi:MAG TPA: ABC transporter permease [Saprospiraceae bacterium]|nr:ABC transporter permease [Saprospiraceae bacterium]
MIVFLKVLNEALRQAMDSLFANKLRTFLSLLGITIGIFCIIAVKSAVDSLEQNIKDGFNELGSDVIYLDKMPWNEDPDQNYWKYELRPDPSMKDYEAIMRRSNLASNAAYTIFTGGRTIKYKSSAVNNAFIMGSTYDYQEIQNLEFAKGRYFSQIEYNNGQNKVILGAKVAESLFGAVEPLGRDVSLFGQQYQIIGVLEAEGENIFNFINFDEVIWIGFNNLKRFINTSDESSAGRMLNIKAKDGVELEELKGEVTGIIRANRRLSPRAEDNFSINELSMLSQVLDSVFGIINLAGVMIGIFALIIGMFSVANIMFVSVKERTGIIGIKKAIGAKSSVVLLEFLIEAIILCLIGGVMGIVMVFVSLKVISNFIPFAMGLDFTNVLVGVIISVIVGILAGVIPAYRASNLSPVEAIRG